MGEPDVRWVPATTAAYLPHFNGFPLGSVTLTLDVPSTEHFRVGTAEKRVKTMFFD
jgi:hypothetical protein